MADQYIILYAKIIDDKKKGLKITGPYAGPICETMEDAQSASKRLVNESKSNSIIPKIYYMDSCSYDAIFDKARPYFDRLKENVVSAKGIMDTPYKKRKRKFRK